MHWNSLQTRITLSITGIVAISLIITVAFFSSRAKQELSNAMDENAINLLNATKNQVESQYNSIQYYKNAIINRRKKELKNNTAIVLNMIESAYNDYREIGISEAVAKQRVMNKIKQVRYSDGVGYFWINDTTMPIPKIIMHPIRPDLVGKSTDGPRYHRIKNSSANLFAAFLNIAIQKGEGYVEYLWPKPLPSGLTVDQPKIGFVKIFKPWNWIIGTGIYIDDIELDVKKRTEAVIRDLNKTISKQKVGENGYFFIFDRSNFMLAHPLYGGAGGNQLINPETKKRILEELKQAYHNKTGSLEYFWDKPEDKGNFIYAKKSYITYFEPLGWYIASSVYEKDYENKIAAMIKTIFIFSLLFIGASLLVAYLISRSITNPLSSLIKSISNSDDDGIPVDKISEVGASEIRSLSSTINKMVTSITQSRNQLEESETFNKALFQDSRIPLIVMDSESYKFIDCNQAAADIYGFSSIAETIGKGPLDVSATYQNNGELSASTVYSFIAEAQEKGSVLFEWLHQKKNGELWDAEVQLVSIIYQNRNLLQFSLLDITARKKAQEELSHSRKMDAIGQLAGGIAHDFNNLISGIMTSAQLLKLPKRNLDEKSIEFVNIILKASTRAADLTDKLLAFGRKVENATTEIDLHLVLEETIELLTNTIDKKITITLASSATNCHILGDHTELQNVFLNLGINASHAMGKGGKLAFKTRNTLLNQAYCDTSPFEIEPGEYIEIEISDTGSGIDMANISKIFEPFYTTRDQGKGSGLGLSTVYGTTQSHHGAINVFSELNAGTIFHLYLPTVETTGTITPPQSENDQIVTGAGTVLLVDDEEMIRKVCRSMLEDLGYKVILAKNGLEAVTIFNQQHDEIDLIITDMIMPIMNGRDAFYKFKLIDNNCKVILASGFTKNENLDKMYAAGLSGFIKKPFKNSELSQLIAKILRTSR